MWNQAGRMARRAAGLCAGLVMTVSAAAAQTYPAKPIKLVVPFPPGGVADVLARPVAQKLTEALGQPVIVENRGGATGTLGAASVASAPADGYTLLFGTTNELSMSPNLYEKLPYDPAKAFTAITPVAAFPNVLVVRPDLPVNSLDEFVALARAEPGKLDFATSGSGSTNHLTGEILKSLAHIDITHVHYRGGGPALTDVMGGHVDALFATLPSAVGHVKNGKLKALVVTSDKRSGALPNVPSAKETSFGDLIVSTWNGVLAPAGIPRPIAERLHAEIVKAVATPEVQDRMVGVGAEVFTTSSEEFSAIVARDFARWSEVVKKSGAKAE